eukprot:jgi/Botrbrau1/3771/Bobra.0183s0006.1
MSSAPDSEPWRYPPNWLVDEILTRCSNLEVKFLRQVCREWRHDFTSRLIVLKPRSIKADLPRIFPELSCLDISNVTGPSTMDLNELTTLRNLQYLRVRGNYMTGDQHLQEIAGLLSLRTLILTGAKSVTDNGLAILNVLDNLEHLVLYGADGISGTGLSSLKSCKHLQLMDLSGCHNISAYGLIQIATLTNLKRLFIHDVDITHRIEGTVAEHELQASNVQSLFVSLPGLLSLGLNYLSNSPAYIAGLSKMTTLTELTLGPDLDSSEWARALQTLHALRKLRLRFESLHAEDLVLMTEGLKDVGFLRLQSTSLDDSCIAALKPLVRLTALELVDCHGVSNSGFAELLPRLSLLGSLMLTCSEVTTALCDFVCQDAPLSRLDLSSSDRLGGLFPHPCSKVQLEALNLNKCIFISALDSMAFQKLRILRLKSCEGLTLDSLRNLSNLTSLEELHLACIPRVDDNVLGSLKNLTRLTALDVSSTRVTGGSMGVVRYFQHLQYLNLTNCRIYDGSLRYLRSCTGLRRLNCSYCRTLTAANCVNDIYYLSRHSLQKVCFQGCPYISQNQLMPMLHSLDSTVSLTFAISL